ATRAWRCGRTGASGRAMVGKVAVSWASGCSTGARLAYASADGGGLLDALLLREARSGIGLSPSSVEPTRTRKLAGREPFPSNHSTPSCATSISHRYSPGSGGALIVSARRHVAPAPSVAGRLVRPSSRVSRRALAASRQ